MVAGVFARNIYKQTEITLKIIVIWDLMLLDLVGREQRFGENLLPPYSGWTDCDLMFV
jgi:hypothetical protein